MTEPCSGPLIWHDVEGEPPAAVLECAAGDCDYLIATGQFNDERHACTPLLRGGF